MDLVLIVVNRTVIYYYNYMYYSASADYGVDRTRANQPLTFQSHSRSKVTSLIDRLKYTFDVTRDPSSNRQLYQYNDCNRRFTTLQSLRDT